MDRKEFLRTTFKGVAVGIGLCWSGLVQGARDAWAQEKPHTPLSRAELIAAAREIIAGQQFCALTTLDPEGRSQVRTMNPFPPQEDMTVWIATSTLTRKVQHIRQDPRVNLYYSDHGKGTGYVAITGKAVLVDDRAEMIKRKRAYWDSSFPGFKNLVLIKVVPESMDVLNYSRGAVADPNTWRTPSVEFSTKSASAGSPPE